MNHTPTEQQLQVIKDRVLEAADHYNRTGTLQGTQVPSHDILQPLHEALFCYKYDTGCPACIGDAIRNLGNIYRAHAPKHLIQLSTNDNPATGQSEPESEGILTGIANTIRNAAGRFAKKPAEPATTDNRVTIGPDTIRVEVPEHLMESVKDIIQKYHAGIQEATTGEGIKQVMDDTTAILSSLMPDKAEHWNMAIAQQWDHMVAQVTETKQEDNA